MKLELHVHDPLTTGAGIGRKACWQIAEALQLAAEQRDRIRLATTILLIARPFTDGYVPADPERGTPRFVMQVRLLGENGVEHPIPCVGDNRLNIAVFPTSKDTEGFAVFHIGGNRKDTYQGKWSALTKHIAMDVLEALLT